jgi:ubiquinone/menaquinone biosynthesis C-methylase UbiE
MTDISDIDWNEAWKNPGRDHNNAFITCLARWSDPERCKKFDRTVKEDNYQGSQARIHAMDIRPDSRVLDIGAGPGTLAIPLSRCVRYVTAVEPSPGMVACLDENIRDGGIRNISIVQRPWEDVDLATDLDPPYDIVVASYSLGVPDLKEALLKMDAVTCRHVYVFWFADMQSPWRRNYNEIWESLFGVPAREKNPPNIIFNLLYQLGIYANVEVTKEEHCTRFSSIDEAVADQSAGLKLTRPEQEALLRDYLSKNLIVKDGTYLLKGISYQAKIWWKKEE